MSRGLLLLFIGDTIRLRLKRLWTSLTKKTYINYIKKQTQNILSNFSKYKGY